MLSWYPDILSEKDFYVLGIYLINLKVGNSFRYVIIDPSIVGEISSAFSIFSKNE